MKYFVVPQCTLTWYAFVMGIAHVTVRTSADRSVFVNVTECVSSAHVALDARIDATRIDTLSVVAAFIISVTFSPRQVWISRHCNNKV